MKNAEATYCRLFCTSVLITKLMLYWMAIIAVLPCSQYTYYTLWSVGAYRGMVAISKVHFRNRHRFWTRLKSAILCSCSLGQWIAYCTCNRDIMLHEEHSSMTLQPSPCNLYLSFQFFISPFQITLQYTCCFFLCWFLWTKCFNPWYMYLKLRLINLRHCEVSE